MKKIIAIVTIMTIFSVKASEQEVKTATATVNSFEKLFGVTKGKRRNHTKGFCFVANLEPSDPSIQQFSKSELFNSQSKVVGRFSHKGGNNSASDSKVGEYGISLSITTSKGQNHRMSLNTLDFFPVSTPQEFAKLMAAKVQGKAAISEFKSQSPDLQRFAKHHANKSKQLIPYESMTFNSLNSFYLVNEKNDKTAVRFSLSPVKRQEIVVPINENFFFQNLNKNLNLGEVSWGLKFIFAKADDDVKNAAIPWTGTHSEIVGGKLKLLEISRESSGNCDSVNFDPLVLSDGFEASADPLLRARSLSYAQSFARRLKELQTSL